MSAVPIIPAPVRTLAQLEAWIELHAHEAKGVADRLRFAVAVMDRAAEIGGRTALLADEEVFYDRGGPR